MVVRKRRGVNKQLGKRTRGNGDTKNRRGAGSRGGRGLAGSHKHKFTKYAGKFGTEKKKIRSKYEKRAISIDQLLQVMPRLEAEGKISSESGLVLVDGRKIGFAKLLSTGSLDKKLLLRNMKASKKAVEKIEKAGGRIEGMAGDEETLDSEEEGEEEESEGQEQEAEGQEEEGGSENEKTEGANK